MVSFPFNATSSYATNGSADQTHEDNQGNAIAAIVLLASGLVGCTVALLALGRDFFEGKNPPTVCIGALVWVDFVGVFSTAVLVFNGIVKGEDWLEDRVVSLNSPFLYNKYATPRLARGSCLLLVMLCIALGALPFVNVGDYVLNETSRSFCHFNWFPVDRAGKVFSFTLGSFGALLASVMTFSNIFVFIVVVRIKRRMLKLFPCDHTSRERRGAFRQEERMAKFVALAAIVFLFTWLPIRTFCNAFRVFPSQYLDSLSTKLVAVNFILDPLMYVLFKGRFRKKLRLSLNEMTEFIGEVNIGQKLRKQTVRVEDAAAEDRNISAIGPAECSAQSPGFFTTAFGLSSGVVVTFMSLDRVVSLNSPFLYNKYATPRLARGSCLLLVMLCIALGALPFVNVGDYVLNETSRSSCHFNWFPVDRAGKVFSFTMGSFGALLASIMTFSNIFVFIVVVRIKRRMSKLFPCDHNSRRRARRGAFRQEERMAKFVALAAVVFLFTWLPVTIRTFCNAFRVFPSQYLDNLSTKLVIVNFILDPLMYVLFKGRFRKNCDSPSTR
ncbi:Prostacyclin receptor [Acropora cervicornis]|uniref:Prostacyclin receptor n=1 Tax=Acropora cervicornis TaxID=6130 RepID=A0AAD9R0M0_ACRCE|nr:Prostacyclin receptor [Acropora cervicornis]